MRKVEQWPLELKNLQRRSMKVPRVIIKVTTIHFFSFSLSIHMIIAGCELITRTHQADDYTEAEKKIGL